MSSFKKTVCCFLAIVASFLVISSPALGRYRYRSRGRRYYGRGRYYNRRGYNPYYGFGPGAYLAGAARVINAQGQYLRQSEYARVLREKAYQQYLISQKQAFQLSKYIEANTPTYTETLEKNKGMRERRILNNPTQSEIDSGEALNVLLSLLKQMGDQGIIGPPVSLNPDTLKKVSVTSNEDKTNIGMLRNGGKLDWPLPLQRNSLAKDLEKSIPTMVSEFKKGKADSKLYYKVRHEVVRLRDVMKNRYANEKLDASSYLVADDFLEKLSRAVYGLEKPGAARLLKGDSQPQGRNVQELVSNMSEKGEKFAPASPGKESAYNALYNALSSYAVGTQHDFGFQLQAVAPRKNFRIQP